MRRRIAPKGTFERSKAAFRGGSVTWRTYRPTSASNWTNWTADDINSVKNEVSLTTGEDSAYWQHTLPSSGNDARVDILFDWDITEAPGSGISYRVKLRAVTNDLLFVGKVSASLVSSSGQVLANLGDVNVPASAGWMIATWHSNQSLYSGGSPSNTRLRFTLKGEGGSGYYEIDAIDAVAGITSGGASTGSGSGSGSSSELPAATRTVNVSTASELSSALASAQPGDHIILADGTYSGTFTLSVAGTSSAQIVIRAENLLGATISGRIEMSSSYNTLWGLKLSSGTIIYPWTGSYCKVLRCLFDGGTTNSTGITAEIRGTDCEFAYNEIRNCVGRGVSVRTSAGARRAHIHHNYFHDWVGTQGTNGTEPIQIGQGTSDEEIAASCTVEYNLIDRCNVDDEAISIKSRQNTIRYNTLLNSTLAAIHCRVGDGNSVEGNWVENSGGIRVMDKNNVLLGNIVTGSGDFQIFAGDRGPDDPIGDPPKYYPAAWYTVLAGNNGPLKIGHYYSSASATMTVTADGTVVEEHTGTITYLRQSGTSVASTATRSFPTPSKLSAAQVGPNA